MLALPHCNSNITDNQEGQGHSVIRTMYEHLDEVTCLEFHPNRPILASGSRDRQVKLFNYSKKNVNYAFKTITVSYSYAYLKFPQHNCIVYIIFKLIILDLTDYIY